MSFESDEQLSTFSVELTGAESGTLVRGDFTESGSGPYTYDATYSGSSDGDYTATLDTAEDGDGNDGASGQSDTTTVSILSQDQTVVYEGLEAVAGDGGRTATLSPSGVQALGTPDTDLTGDGTNNLPYIDSNGDVKITDGAGNTQTLVSNSHSSDPKESTTLMGVGQWDGSDTSVFYVDSSGNSIYRVDDGGTPTVVETPSSGAKGVLGTGDVTGDGNDELLFLDSSSQVRYVEAGGGVKKLNGGGAGANNGIGVGQPVDIDGDGTDRVVIIDGSQNVKLVGEPPVGDKTFSSASAKKGPVTSADVDDDSNTEIVYVGSGGDVKYIDDPLGSAQIKPLKDDLGNTVTGDGALGVVS